MGDIMTNSIRNVNVKNKKVIIRCDLNVPIKDNKILDDTRIIKSLETIKYLLDNGASLIILSHLGKIKKPDDMVTNTLEPIGVRLSELLNKEITFISQTRGRELSLACKKLKPKEIILVENTRFEDLPNNYESSCDEKLSKYWASLGDVFVNDAFGSSHRKHASVCGISKYLPSYNGLLIEKEVKVLDKLLKNPERPYTVIMGGAKVDDKIELIKSIIVKCDYLVVGGGIANTFLKVNGYKVGNSLISDAFDSEIKQIISDNKDKIIMPVDVMVGKDNTDFCEVRELNNIQHDEKIYDIGPKTINLFRSTIYNSNTIFINGTVGLSENKLFETGTKEILMACNDSDATVIAAGGDCVSAVNRYGYNDDFLISTGGGA